MATYRFTFPQESVLFAAIPALENVSVTPGVVDPGVSMGQRASIRIAFKDFRYPLEGTDYASGTFFGKLRARRKSLQGLPLRIIRGVVGQDIGDMPTEHYVIESLSRSADDVVSIVAKDLLKLADGDRAQAPAVSRGRLAAAIDSDDTEVDLAPAGIGDEYPESGKLALGGSEIVTFTRDGDTLTIVRSQSGTEATDHDEEEVAQLVLEYDAESPADIVYDLLTNYTDIDPDWCPLDEWKADIDTYIGRLYSAEIADPTPVKKLVDELIEQTGLVMWWDAIAREIKLKSLRPVTGGRVVNTDEIVAGTFNFAEQPSKRVSEVWTYFALRNPLAKLDDPQNYRSVSVLIDPEAETEYGQQAIRKVYSRWIAIDNRSAADRLNTLLLSRYRDPPRKFSFDLSLSSAAPGLGDGVRLGHWSLQDEDGELVTAPAQITSIRRDEDGYSCDAEEMLFTETEGDRVVIIDSNRLNVNLRDLYDQFYLPPSGSETVTFIISAGVFVGTPWMNANPPRDNDRAIDVGDWPEEPELLLINNGNIIAGGGTGKDARQATGLTISGATGLYTRVPITVENNGIIAGGGGGGGRGTTFGGGGGGGFSMNALGVQNFAPGGPNSNGAVTAQPGSLFTGGAAGGAGAGAGGDLGEPGVDGNTGLGDPGTGGAAGIAVDGDDLVTFSIEGDIRGPRVNA